MNYPSMLGGNRGSITTPTTPAKKDLVTNNTGMEENQPKTKKQGLLITLLIFIGIYAIYNYVQNSDSVPETLKGENIKANVNNIMVIGLGAIIFFTITKILFTKMSMSSVKWISAIGTHVLPFVEDK